MAVCSAFENAKLFVKHIALKVIENVAKKQQGFGKV